jgi:hypothetical protein
LPDRARNVLTSSSETSSSVLPRAVGSVLVQIRPELPLDLPKHGRLERNAEYPDVLGEGRMIA